jgi:hypothetical protein
MQARPSFWVRPMPACMVGTQNGWGCPPEELCCEIQKLAKHSTVPTTSWHRNVFEKADALKLTTTFPKTYSEVTDEKNSRSCL